MNSTGTGQPSRATTRRSWRRAIAAVGGIGLLATTLAISSPASGAPTAGTAYVSVSLASFTASTDISAIDVDLFVGGSSTVDCTFVQLTGQGPTHGSADWTCNNVPFDTEHVVAIDGVDDYEVRLGLGNVCNVSSPTPTEFVEMTDLTFTVTIEEPIANCYANLGRAGVLIDKVVDGGDATAADFTLEVYPEGGGAPLSAVDPSDDECASPDPATCALVNVPSGTHQLGEIPAAGYLPTNVWCTPYYGVNGIVDDEVFPTGVGEFTVGTDEASMLFAYCQVTNEPFSASLYVNKVVVNDDGGGTATAEDFTAEAYTEPGGSLAASTDCIADGTCIATTLPIGEYRIGETGPAGYTATVVCETTTEPEQPPIDTTPPVQLTPDPVEAIEGDGAVVELEPFGEYTCTITNDDITTTTTTTTTVAPTTTAAPTTTLAPILPPTGPNDSTGPIALVALLFLVGGAGIVLALRRN